MFGSKFNVWFEHFHVSGILDHAEPASHISIQVTWMNWRNWIRQRKLPVRAQGEFAKDEDSNGR
jgi:hypothetical protein